jgi:hypothetical protein
MRFRLLSRKNLGRGDGMTALRWHVLWGIIRVKTIGGSRALIFLRQMATDLVDGAPANLVQPPLPAYYQTWLEVEEPSDVERSPPFLRRYLKYTIMSRIATAKTTIAPFQMAPL